MAGKLSWGKSLPVTAASSVADDLSFAQPIFGYVALLEDRTTPEEASGKRWLDSDVELLDAGAYAVDDATADAAVAWVQKQGLTVLARSRLGLALVGHRHAWSKLHDGQTAVRVAMLQRRGGQFEYVPYVDIVQRPGGPEQHPDARLGRVRDDVEHIAALGLEMRRTPLEVSATAPHIKRRHHLRVEDVAALTGATRAHEMRCRGRGATVAIVDTGHYAHPFFNKYEVRTPVTIVPGTSSRRDPLGHGTAMAANVVAVAPAADLWPYRASNDAGDLVAPLAGFMRAKADRPTDDAGKGMPYVITCSWGAELSGPLPNSPRGMDRAMVLEIRDAIEQGIVVVFAAGNGAHSIEAQVPGVISAGAAYVDEQVAVIASDYGTAYASRWQPDVAVPTVCGLVGMRPRAAYIALPVPPGSIIDVERSKASDDDPPDGTKPDDGWALLSGTSAAAPQVAGAAAVLLGENPKLTPADVSEALCKSALDIKAGRCHPRFAYEAGEPGEGSDIPTGHGLIDVAKAVEYSRAQYAR